MAAIGASAISTGCRKRQRPHGSITVFVYAGLDKLFQEHFADPFEAKMGVKVVLDAGWWDAIGKLKTSPTGKPVYDLVLTDATQGYPRPNPACSVKLTSRRFRITGALAPVALDNWVAKDRYGVTFHESAMTLVWDAGNSGFEPGTGAT